jgi:predicted nucleic acid-binding protein
MTVGVVDSTVIVHLFRKAPAALRWYDSLSQALAITPITWMEIMYGAAGKAGQAKCKAILNEFDMEYLIRSDMDWAMQQLERYRLSHGVETNGLPDRFGVASVASTAIYPQCQGHAGTSG